MEVDRAGGSLVHRGLGVSQTAGPGAKFSWQGFRAMALWTKLLASFALLVVLLVSVAVVSTPSSHKAGNPPPPSSSLPAGPASSAAPTTSSSTSTTSTTTTTRVTTTTAPATGSRCRVRGSGVRVRPDPACTPGARNPSVNQANIDSTICRAGWTETVRPPESYTDDLKYEQMLSYGDRGSPSGYEEDHLIPLELGGSPASPKNLWPEPGPIPNPKDAVENAARHAVCDGSMSLAAAQQAIARDWVRLASVLGVTISSPSPATTPPGTSPTTSTHDYKAGQFCPKAMIGQTIQTPSGPLTCKVLSDPDHPHWVTA